MAAAKKCDICGTLYETYNETNDDENTNGFMFANIDANQKYYSHEIIDCCPDCMKSIKKHIELLKSKKKEEERLKS